MQIKQQSEGKASFILCCWDHSGIKLPLAKYHHYSISIHIVSQVPKRGGQGHSVVCGDTKRGRSIGQAGKGLTAS